MNKLLQHRSLIRENLVLLVGICLCFYFSYHAFQGNRSFIRLLLLNGEVAHLLQDYEQAKTEREAIEQKVIAMRPGKISRDLLEERVRTVLGYVHPDDVVVNGN